MIFVKLGRESVSLDPTATTGSTVPVFESRETEVNSVRDMLYSGGLMEKVVDRIGPKVVLGKEAMGEIQPGFPEPPAEDVKGSPRQLAIKFLKEKINVTSSRKSSVLAVSCEAKTPSLAQKILEVYLEAYKQMHSVAHQTPKSNQFFADQTELLQTQWKQAMEELRDAKERAGVVSIEGTQEILKLQTNVTQSRLMKVEGELEAKQAELNALQEIADKPMNARGARKELQKAQASLASLTAEKNALSIQMDQLVERAAKLNRDEVEIRQLEQQAKVAKVKFSQYQDLYEQTRIEGALLSGKFTNVRVVQSPSFVPKPVSPKRKILAACGLVLGIAGAFLISVLSEFSGGDRPGRQRQTSPTGTAPTGRLRPEMSTGPGSSSLA